MLDRWADGDAYQAFMASWSRVAGAALIRWLDLPRGLRWLDVGCGTGALSEMMAHRDRCLG
jgi:2-polyprenyl-3-methyl-5-hydroxy-6-metoxy-1,4-benzoquinol methylase